MRSHFFKLISYPALLVILLASCRKKDIVGDLLDYQLTPYPISYPNYFPAMQIPSNNPLTVEGVNLGKRLYYDPILSNNGNSCSSCHNQSESFSSFAVNSLPHLNLGWNTEK
jgi:cytochrome c peroxidase